MDAIMQGASQFRERQFEPNRSFFRTLSGGQHPHTCFITCGDSRVDPRLLTGCDLGELFVVRNAGNIIPPDNGAPNSEAAAIEFAVSLGVRDVVVCGHSHCGAMKGLFSDPEDLSHPAVSGWLTHANVTRQRVLEKFPNAPSDELPWLAVQENVVVQLENLRTLPCIAGLLGPGGLRLHGWVYKIETGEVLSFDSSSNAFVTLEEAAKQQLAEAKLSYVPASQRMAAIGGKDETVSARILVIEDEARIADFLVRGLAEEGYQVEHAADGRSGAQALQTGSWDLVLLDWWLPVEDGIQLLKRFRHQDRTTPVLFLTARDAVAQRVEGLDAGANDYLTKPFAFDELLARVRALLRTSSQASGLMLEYGDIRADLASQRATRGGVALDLTAKEFSLLAFFLRHPGTVLSRTRIFETVWGEQFDGLSNTLEVHVKEVRRKLEAFGPRVIQTHRGRGYMLDSNLPGEV